jgi:trimeric autotransporter adhesin
MKKYIVLIGLLWITHESWAQLYKTPYGSNAGHNSQGAFDSFFGLSAGFQSNANSSNPIEGENSFFGAYTGYKNLGKQNTYIGVWSGGNSYGNDNVAMGYYAGYGSKGNANVYIGRYTASGGSKGGNNVFLGYQSGRYNQSGHANTFLGKESGLNNTGGYENLFAGHKSGYTNHTGFQNVFLGHYSGYYNSYGVRNTFIGPFAGYKNVSGDRNVFIGYQAGYYEEGNDKLYISNSSTSPLLYGDLQRKKLVVGGKTDSDYTLHILGEAFSTGNWVSSDQRYKKDIKTIESAAEKILALEGKSYAFKENASTKNDSSVARLAFHEGRQFGFLAQEMKEVLPELVREDEDGYLAVNYDGIIPVLVEAFKELKGTNEKLEGEINRLQQEIAQLSGKEDAYTPGKQGHPDFNKIIEPSIILHQNVPNPFDQSTEIRYEVPVGARQVNLYVYNLEGKEIAKFSHLPAGKGSVKITAFQLETGTYLYSLIADGKVLDTKRMIVTP